MNEEAAKPFESIESALEFMTLLEEAIDEASGQLQEMQQNCAGERQTEALGLALYKMGQLSTYTQKSRRILNDLGLIRGLLTSKGEALEPDDPSPPDE
jgi:hypothetical protein